MNEIKKYLNYNSKLVKGLWVLGIMKHVLVFVSDKAVVKGDELGFCFFNFGVFYIKNL